MRIVVTGANGFVGRHLIKRLRDDGHEIRALVGSDRFADRLPDDLDTHLINLGDPAAISKAAAGYEGLVHLAGIHDDRSSRDTLGWINVAMTENVFRACRHAGLKRGMLLSCTDVVLNKEVRSQAEEHHGIAGRCLCRVGQSKTEAEEQVIALGSDAFMTSVIRASRIWGPDDTSILPHLCDEALSNNGILLPSKSNLISTTFIGNLVDAFSLSFGKAPLHGDIVHINDQELVLASEFYGDLSRAVGLPSPRHPSLLAKALASLRHHPGLSKSEAMRRGVSRTFSTQRARESLGYEAQHSVADGMKALSEWASAYSPTQIASWKRPSPNQEAVDKLRTSA